MKPLVTVEADLVTRLCQALDDAAGSCSDDASCWREHAEAMLQVMQPELDAAYRRGVEDAAKVADDRAAICFDAVAKIEAGTLYPNRPRAETAATERCAGMEAAHIARSIRALIEQEAKSDG